jgi:hypothetical protein
MPYVACRLGARIIGISIDPCAAASLRIAHPMTEPPLISVIVPCYNARPWIAAALRSVLAQGVGPLQVLVVDDGSQDETGAFVARAFPAVHVLRQTNAGVAAARNRGLAVAHGRWVAFIDADDLWLPGKLSAQLAALQAQPDARMAYTAWHVWESEVPEPDPQWLQTLPTHLPGPSGDVYPALLLECAVWTSTVLADRALLQELGGFDQALPVGEDYDLWLRASRLTPVLRVPQPLALYRQHPRSLTRRAPARNWQALVVQRAVQRWGYTGPSGRQADPGAVRRALATSWRDFAGAQLAAGQAAQGWAAARQALQGDWRHPGAWKLAVKAAAQRLGLPT